MAANVNPKIRNPAKSKNDPNSASMIASETHSVLFEWPLSGLKTMFDSTKADTKSRVVKSTPFGGGRWTVLFYAQSGTDQFCSLYLNAEPLPHERTQSLNANSWMQASQNKEKNEMEDSWSREGNYRFTFTIQTPDKSVILGTKEANNHMFSMKTSNWGWAQFSKRDTVYYGNQLVKTADQFIITVSITASAERPRLMKPLSLNVPPQLVQAMGSLLDDPDHSDVVFHLVSQRRPSRSSNNNNNRRSKNSSITSPSNQQQSPVKKIYAIRKILSSRCEYFADMFEGGFAEAECAEFSDDEDDVGGNENQVWSLESPPSKDLGHNQEPSTSDSNPQGGVGGQDAYDALDEEHGQHGEATQANHNNNNSKDMDLDEEFYTDEEDEEDNFILEDSDEELEGPNNRETSPVTFNFGSKGVRSSNAQTISSSRFNSRKSGGGGVGKEVRIGGDEGDEDEEDQDDDEFVEEDEVVGIPKPAGVSQNSSASTGNQRTQVFGRQNATSSSNLNPISNENASQPQQEGSNDNETPAFTFGSLSAVDNNHNTSTSTSGGRFAQSQPQTSNSIPTAFGLTINPEIPTQSLMSRSNSNSTGPVPLDVSATNQNLSLSNNSPSKNINPIITPSSHTSTPVKKSTAIQNPKATPNPHAKRSREKSDGTNRTADRRKRRKVVVRDSAYNTYKALLYYLYTDTITFAPLTSSFLTSNSSAQNDVEGDLSMNDSHRSNGLNAENYQEEMIKAHKRRQAMIDWWCSQNPDKPSPCSAKAMYKLADKLQIPELKRRAQEHIAASLTVQNIVWEVFSGFNAQFAEIRKMETDYLLQHWSIIKKSSAMKTIFFRSQAHPGLAEVWPYLLSQLEYKASGDDSDSEIEQV